MPLEIKRTPLQVAIGVGFHSLVELIARHEGSQEVKNRALEDAVAEKRLDFVELLLANGAEIRAVPLADVLTNWEPAMIRFFLDHGADVITGAPFAVAFGEKIRTSLRPFMDYKEAHPELANELQEQIDHALRYFCQEGDLKWISLLLWAGANPRTLSLSLANCYSAHDSLGFPVLLRFCDAQSGRSFYPLHRCPGPLARTWRRC